MKKLLLLLLFGFSILNNTKAQTFITWELLKDVSFVSVWSEEYMAEYQVARFGKNIKQFNNKKIQIKGYIIPVDVLADYYVLSANPYASCFFCGKAGPESVMDIHFIKVPTGLRLDQVITVQGTLRLNSDNIAELNYILDDVVLIE